jgi:hypothetical protein
VAFSQPNLTVEDGTTLTYPNPTALGGQPATAVQIQNSSAFIIQVVGGGEQFIIQPFVAQTIPIAQQGTPITIEGIGLPSGLSASADTLTLIWLLSGEQPPMQDGPLTAAALIASLLPPGTVFGPVATALVGDNVTYTFTVPANTRTLIVSNSETSFVHTLPPLNISITGQQTGFVYYNQPPYLTSSTTIGSEDVIGFLVVCPVNGAADTTFQIVIAYNPASLPTATPTNTVYADSDQYPESVFYNGPLQVVEVDATGTLITGPARLLALTASWDNGADVAVNYVPIGGGLQVLLIVAPTTESGACPISLPADTILRAGDAITVTIAGAGSVVSATSAYP